ncbi:MAG: hypothetical protein GXY36_11765 [Chloroflexi bacterium]|nr:hypothetical protein [Chloroflexota bacterium]
MGHYSHALVVHTGRAHRRVSDDDSPRKSNSPGPDRRADLLNYPMDRVYSNLEHYGNTSAASIPIALAEAADAGCFRPGDTLGLIGFGGGLTWGAAIVEWTGSGTARP